MVGTILNKRQLMAEQAKKAQKKAHTTKPSFRTALNSILGLL